MDVKRLKDLVCAAIDEHSGQLIEFGEDIYRNPELGYMEHRTAGKVEEKFREFGLEYQKGIAVTGLKARLKGSTSKVTVGVMGELDAMVCSAHPHANPETGAVHACAHNAQITSMIGVALGLKAVDAGKWLGGDVAFLAVPSEEGLGLPKDDTPVGRAISELWESGRIRFSGGKQQFIYENALDDVDMMMMVHSGPMNKMMMEDSPHGMEYKVGVGGSFAGSVAKNARFIGKGAHPAIAAHLGTNALSAANLALHAIHANREGFRDEDMVRVHAVVTKGGIPHSIPDDVRMESVVRSNNIEALKDACSKVDRSFKGGALAMGAEVDIVTAPGYMPCKMSKALSDAFRKNAEILVGRDMVGEVKAVAGTTDMGDISHLMPVFHGRAGGITGRAHEPDYRIEDKYLAYIVPAKAMAMTVIDLLWGEADAALKIKEEFVPVLDKSSWLETWKEIVGKNSNWSKS